MSYTKHTKADALRKHIYGVPVQKIDVVVEEDLENAGVL